MPSKLSGSIIKALAYRWVTFRLGGSERGLRLASRSIHTETSSNGSSTFASTAITLLGMNAMTSVISVPPPQTFVGNSKWAKFRSLEPTTAAIEAGRYPLAKTQDFAASAMLYPSLYWRFLVASKYPWTSRARVTGLSVFGPKYRFMRMAARLRKQDYPGILASPLHRRTPAKRYALVISRRGLLII